MSETDTAVEQVDVIEELRRDKDVNMVLATTSKPMHEAFSDCLCHWLVLFWVEPTKDRPLYEFEVENEITALATDALQQQVLAHANDLR